MSPASQREEPRTARTFENGARSNYLEKFNPWGSDPRGRKEHHLDKTNDTPEVKPRQQTPAQRKEICSLGGAAVDVFPKLERSLLCIMGKPLDRGRASGAAMNLQPQRRVTLEECASE